MRKKIKNTLRLLLNFKNDTDYYSQGGEDAIASNIFSTILQIKNGIYVDVGAYHPFKHSNTYLLYKAGWRGMNIDPRPGCKKLFDKHRSRDINIEAGIAGTNGMMKYYIVEEGSTMNTFSLENLTRLGMVDIIKKTLEIPVYTLASLLSKHSEIGHIDYLNIDAEGFEMEIMGEMGKIQPKVISIEQNNILTLTDVVSSAACEYLSSKGYVPVAKNIILKDVSTVFYILKKLLPFT